jgi:hypothetical protein
LDAAVKTYPEAHWWIKDDGCDLVQGLCESVSGVWSGDVDLNDGSLRRSFDECKVKLSLISQTSFGSRRGKATIKDDLSTIHTQVLSDKEFIIKGNIQKV